MSCKTRIALLAIDVDGTLLTDTHEVPVVVKDAIAAARQRGVRVILASARGPAAVRPILADLGFEGLAVCFGGAWVGRVGNCGPASSQVLIERPVPLHTARRVVRLALEHGVSPGWHSGEAWYVPAVSLAVRREAAVTGMTPIVQPDPDALTAPPHKILCIDVVPAGRDRLRRLAEVVRGDCSVAFSHDNYLEITSAGVDKASALRLLGKRLGIGRVQMAAIGDSENDIGMVAEAGVGVAMGNAIDRLKSIAAWVTDTNNNAGVASTIERLMALGHI